LLDEKAKLDYEQVLGIFKLLTEVRFKLLALVPSISGTAVALLTSTGLGTAEQVALASLGFFVTLGILFYEQRNTQLYNNVVGRAEYLEETLGLSSAAEHEAGGLFASRKRAPRRLFGIVPMRHDRGLALIYAAVLGAWLFAALEAYVSSVHAALAGATVAFALFVDLERLDGTAARLRQAWPRRSRPAPHSSDA
jgi:hypothetical protein